MKRRVYLKGELAEKFGEEHSVFGNTIREVLQTIDCNRPGFLNYFKAHSKDYFTLQVEKDDLDEKSIIMPLNAGDITIQPVPAGAGGNSGVKKVIIGLTLIAAAYFLGPLGGGIAGFELNAAAAFAIASVGVNLAMTGIQELMAPDPATDNEQDESYLFTGANQKLIRGVAVPVLYGELRVPGIPLSFSITKNKFYTSNSFVDTRGNLYLIQ